MKNTTEKRILLLNPPGKFTFLRDYYCSSISKAGYYWPPIDLLVLSGILGKGYKIHIIDGIIQKLNFKKCAYEIERIKPGVIIFLSSVLSYKEDFDFIRHVKENLNTMAIGCGEIFLETPKKILNDNPFIDGIILDFTSTEIVEFIGNPAGFDYVLRFQTGEQKKYFKYPPPRHDKFSLYKYRYPYNRKRPFTSVLTTYGCPYRCYFCNSGNIGFKLRQIKNVLDELKSIVESGIKEIFFADMTFGADRNHAVELCKAILDEGLKIQWHCYSRVDILDEELLFLMKEAGCYLIQFGVENADPVIMSKYGKNIPVAKIRDTFDIVKKYKVLAGAHFLFGLPGESLQSVKKSIDFAMELNPDYVSFNIFSPRKCSVLSMEKTPVNADILNRYIRKGYLRFYLRPVYLMKKLLKIRSFYELGNLLYMGSALAGNIIRGRV